MTTMNENVVSEGVMSQVKKTKNTSVKNLRVEVFHNEEKTNHIIKNMCQVWKFIRAHYNDETNLKDQIKVFHNDNLIHDLYAEKKLSGKIWKIDRLHENMFVKKND